MSGFRLIAIQVLDHCFKDIRKILPLGELYMFTSDYDIEKNNQQQVTSINLIPKESFNLYNIRRENQEDLLINISAVVGKNGSGKSTILELFYAFCLCISKDQKDIASELNKLNDKFPFKRNFIQLLFNHLRIEVFFETGGVVKSIKYDGTDGITNYRFSPLRTIESQPLVLPEFCYTIAINYSVYGLNEINTPWLSPMFHKNDGYQAPLVINPFREEGNIDVNREYHLTNSRLIQNIGLYKQLYPEIVNGQRLYKIKFSFEPQKLDLIHFAGEKYDLNETINYFESQFGESIYSLFNKLTIGLVNQSISPGIISAFNQLKRNGTQTNISNFKKIIFPNDRFSSNENSSLYIEFWFTRYIIKKIFKICLQYTWFRERYIEFKVYNGHNVIGIKNGRIDELTLNLLSDKSHITLKLRQTIMMWHNRYFIDKVTWGTIVNENNNEFFACFCELDSTQLIELTSLDDNRKTFRENTDLELVPGGILIPEILTFREGTDSIGEKIEKLSSGEQQLLFTIQTVLYHLKNIDSIFENNQLNKNRVLAYKNVMIILDEIELYFHPEFQRKFICELLSQISKISINHIKSINLLFSTHSPFILSDIQSSNILKLKDGIGQEYNIKEQTFGSNVHDLLANEFFMENGFMGEWAKYIITDLVLFLNQFNELDEKPKRIWSESSAKATISIIGEPILKTRLERLFDKKFIEHDKILIQRRIEELQAKLAK
jgi:hypothetical protein